ncbi:uncharacterized protein LOC129222919 [Uloborus diversus]|uniref:uncharacterized protein LOC129222919 n=1 Tax=Uloborus diversus TaxID=327109 RepID=UPI0024094520|nr:uncharacterized protein LOC129222919 [Uloborus diversus]
MLIESKHQELRHAGVQALMNHLRENYWILQNRKTVRKAISTCVRCKRFTVTHSEPKCPPLPEDRVRDATIFEITGTDLAGPLYLRDGTKAWIVLYTCAVYRAVHIELITSLTAEAFFQALRRFIAIRGRPEILYSDNGGNFVKAHNELSKLDWGKIESQSSLKKITWRFIPPSVSLRGADGGSG